MDAAEFQRLKDKINDAQLAGASAKGKMEAIEELWEKKYGFRSVEEAEKKLEELKSENEKRQKIRDGKFKELQELVEKSLA